MINRHAPSWPHQTHRSYVAKKRDQDSVWFSADSEKSERLVITATTPHGVVTGHSHWPLLGDGILAWVDRAVMLGVKPGQTDRHRSSMPLVTFSAKKKHVWAATRGIFDSEDVELHNWGRRSDEQYHRHVGGVDGRINVSSGKDKSKWSHDVVRLTGTVQWRMIGIKTVVEEWLSHVEFIGDSKGRGNGLVTKWTVEPVGPFLDKNVSEYDRRLDAFNWLALSGDRATLTRPVYPRFKMKFVPQHSGNTVLGSPRPPYIHPARTSVGRKTEVPVLAADIA